MATVGQYGDEALLSAGGALLPSTAVTVLNMDNSVATLYTDITGGTVGPNPVNTGTTGNLRFFAPTGQYQLKVGGVIVAQVAIAVATGTTWSGGTVTGVSTVNADWSFGTGKTVVKVDTTLATDETAHINSVLAGLGSRGGHVEIVGPCRITGPLTPTKHGTVIKGYGHYGSALVMDSTTADFVQADGLAEFGVEDLQFEAKAGVTRTAGSAIHATGLIDYHLDNLRFQDTFNAANLIDCGAGFLERLRLVDAGVGNTNRGVLLLGCVSTHMYNWIFNWGAANLLTFNAGLRIDSACDTPHGVNLIMQGSSGSGNGLYLASSQTVATSNPVKTGTVNITNGSRVVTAASGFTFTGPTANTFGDQGREITVTGLPAPTRIGRVISTTQAVVTQAATATTAGAAATIPAVGPNAFAPRWVEMTNLAVEGSHPPVFGTNSPAGSAPGVVIDDVTTFHWTSGQSASGLQGMLVNKGRDIVLTSVRLINNEKQGIYAPQTLGSVLDISTVNCRFSDNSQGQYSGVSQHNLWSHVDLTNGTRYNSTSDYFGDYLVGSSRKAKYGIANPAGSVVNVVNPQWGNVGTDTIQNKGSLTYDYFGLTGVGVARAARAVTLADVILVLQNAGFTL